MRKWMIKLSIAVGLVLGFSSVLTAQQDPGLPPDVVAKIKEAEKSGQKLEPTPTATPDPNATPKVSGSFFKPGEAPKSFKEMVELWMTPMPYPKATIERIDDRHAFPHSAVPWKMEIVREEGDTIWMRGLPPEDPESAMHKAWLDQQVLEATLLAKREFDEKIGSGEFLDFDEALVPPATIDALRFDRAGDGLPTSGKWQMGLDLVDFNNDGHLDVVLPPARLAREPHPTIYLGDGKGGFDYWTKPKWSREIPFDYGDVEVADFDGDGNLDLVLAIHFKGQYVLYGAEDFQFGRFEKLPSPDPRVTSRGVAVADFDGDGRIDLAFEAELDLDMTENKRLKEATTVWVVRNTENGWKLDHTKGLPQFVIGDLIVAEDLDGDGRPDITVASNTTAWRGLVFLNRLPEPWVEWDDSRILGNGFHFGVDAVAQTEDRSASVYAAFQQYLRTQKANETRTGIVRYSPVEGDWSQVEPQVIFFDDNRNDYFYRVAVGDMTGNGLDDFVAARKKGGLEVWIQASEGQFFLNSSGSIDVPGRAYGLEIVDVDHDGRGDIVAGTAELEDAVGGVVVLLSRPAS